MNNLKLLYILLNRGLRKKALMAGFDVTSRCNLHCPSCYWLRQKHHKEMDIEKIKELFRDLRKQGIIHCTYIGGEPTLRPDILEECTKIIPYNLIVTNGTTTPLRIKNTLFALSVDGTQEIHDKVRCKGLYQKIWDNYSSHKKTITTTTLMNINKNEPEKLVKEWSKTSVIGMAFNFATPFTNSDNKFWIPWKERDKVIDRLIELKKEYGDFILMTAKQFDQLREKHVKKWSKDCTMRWFGKSFHPNGEQKLPCVLGKHAMCSKCGCHISTFFPESIFKLDFEAIRIYTRVLNAQMKY
jgi:sulfatase maturation enzyme AslB (radical SAM superfamily)